MVSSNPDFGYEIERVYYIPESGVAVDITSTKEFIMPNSNVKVCAEFRIKIYTITICQDGNGTVNLSTDKAVKGTQINVSAEAQTGLKDHL